LEKLRQLKDQDLIKVVTGVRRSGKSTLLKMFMEALIGSGVPVERTLYLNFENPENNPDGEWRSVHDRIISQIIKGQKNYVFLDEILAIPEFERLADGLYVNEDVDLYITGSNAYLLSSELATLLTGRYVEIHVLPFSFAEYSAFITNPQNFIKNESFADLRNLVDFIYNGGLPPAVSMRNSIREHENDFIKAVLNTIIEKDIFKRREIHNKPAFNKIVDFLFDSVGSYV